MRWLVLWLEAVVITVLGILMLYLGPSFLPFGIGTRLSRLAGWLALLPFALMLGGMIGIVVGVVGVALSSSQLRARAAWHGDIGATGTSKSIWWADRTVVAGPIVAATALLAGTLVMSIRPFALSHFLDVVWLAASPLALAGALLSWFGLALGTRRRGTALFGLVLGSLAVVGMVAGFVPFLLLARR